MQSYTSQKYCGRTLKKKIYMKLSLVTKTENVDLEKQVNKLDKFLALPKSIIFTGILFLGTIFSSAQINPDFESGKRYVLAGVRRSEEHTSELQSRPHL